MRALSLFHLVLGSVLLLAVIWSIVTTLATNDRLLFAYVFIFYFFSITIGVIQLVAARLLLRDPRAGLITSLVVGLLDAPVLGVAQAIAGWSDSLHRAARIALVVPLVIVIWTIIVGIRMWLADD